MKIEQRKVARLLCVSHAMINSWVAVFNLEVCDCGALTPESFVKVVVRAVKVDNVKAIEILEEIAMIGVNAYILGKH